MFLELDKYVWAYGCLYMALLKAMYGCVQVSVLWYALIRREIKKMGYTVSETDKCLFVK
jgi:hypothetical protein